MRTAPVLVLACCLLPLLSTFDLAQEDIDSRHVDNSMRDLPTV